MAEPELWRYPAHDSILVRVAHAVVCCVRPAAHRPYEHGVHQPSLRHPVGRITRTTRRWMNNPKAAAGIHGAALGFSFSSEALSREPSESRDASKGRAFIFEYVWVVIRTSASRRTEVRGGPARSESH